MSAKRQNETKDLSTTDGDGHQKIFELSSRQSKTTRRTIDTANVKNSVSSTILTGPLLYHFLKHFDNFLRDQCFKNQNDAKNAINN